MQKRGFRAAEGGQPAYPTHAQLGAKRCLLAGLGAAVLLTAPMACMGAPPTEELELDGGVRDAGDEALAGEAVQPTLDGGL